MSIIRIDALDHTNIRVMSDYSVEQEMSDFFSFMVPGYRFMPTFRSKMWDGKARLYNIHTKKILRGLLPFIHEFAARNEYEIEYTNADDFKKEVINVDFLDEWIDDLNLSNDKGEPIAFRDYQKESIITALVEERNLVLSPTGSGKSAIIYALIRWHIANNRKCILIVPSTSLVEQMYGDFTDYSILNGWNVEKNCQRLYSGFPKEVTTNCMISTWQSIVSQPKSWFGQFDVVIGDEAHTNKAKSLQDIFDKLTETRWRTGTTGSLDGSKIHSLTLQGMFGSIHKVISTRELMDADQLSNLKIKAVVLKYSDEFRKAMKGNTYAAEMDFICANTSRNNFIKNLTINCKGNTLVLFQYVEKHGKPLFELIKAAAGDRKVFLIYGNTPVEERENIRRIMAKEKDAIIVASYGVYQQGINIPSIANIILASPSKSKIRVIQSIGRGLRLSIGKLVCNLFDIADDLKWKSKNNHTLSHALERYKLYAEEQFDMKIIEVNL